MKDRILHVKTLLTDTLFDVALLYVGVWPAYLVGNGLFGLIARAVTDNDHLLAARLFEFFPSLLLMCAVIFIAIAVELFIKNTRDVGREED